MVHSLVFWSHHCRTFIFIVECVLGFHPSYGSKFFVFLVRLLLVPPPRTSAESPSISKRHLSYPSTPNLFYRNQTSEILLSPEAGMHERSKMVAAPVSDARATLLPARRCRALCFFFFFFPQLGADSSQFALNQVDSCRLGPYRAKPLIQVEIKRLLRAVSVRNSLFLIFFFFSSSSLLLCFLLHRP